MYRLAHVMRYHTQHEEDPNKPPLPPVRLAVAACAFEPQLPPSSAHVCAILSVSPSLCLSVPLLCALCAIVHTHVIIPAADGCTCVQSLLVADFSLFNSAADTSTSAIERHGRAATDGCVLWRQLSVSCERAHWQAGEHLYRSRWYAIFLTYTHIMHPLHTLTHPTPYTPSPTP